MSELPAPTLSEQIAEVERVIKLREKIYPSFEEGGQFFRTQADRRITVMRAVLETLKKVSAP